jgi:hypothetical protein
MVAQQRGASRRAGATAGSACATHRHRVEIDPVKLGSGSRCVEIGPRGVASWPLRDEIGSRALGSDRDRVEIVQLR